MGYLERSGYCSNCKKEVLIRAQTPNHVLHLLLTIVTCGFWIIVWIILTISGNKWHCSQCGRSITGLFHDNIPPQQVHIEDMSSLTKKCPVCAETIKIEAIKCRFCGQEFDSEDVARKVAEARDAYESKLWRCPNGYCKTLNIFKPDEPIQQCSKCLDRYNNEGILRRGLINTSPNFSKKSE